MASTSTTPSHPETQHIHLTFTVPERHKTDLHISLRPATDPTKTGYHLLFPGHPPSTFLDFPVCSAKLHARQDEGYAACYGWIQVVSDSSTHDGGWTHDPIPITEGLDTPFAWLGPEAQLFDAPSKIDRSRDIDWTCWSLLAYVPDGLVSRVIRPVVVFEWGYRIVGGKVEAKELRLVDVQRAWEGQRGNFEKWFKGWTFEGLDPEVVVEEVEG